MVDLVVVEHIQLQPLQLDRVTLLLFHHHKETMEALVIQVVDKVLLLAVEEERVQLGEAHQAHKLVVVVVMEPHLLYLALQ
jgi:hypothetical protein